MADAAPAAEGRLDLSGWEARIDAAIRGQGVNLLFQPIVDLQRCVVAGYETLTRFDAEAPGTPDQWFGAAARLGRVAELEETVLQRALAVRASLPRNTFLTVNVEPESLLDDGVMRLLRAQSLAGVAIEVTEHRELGDPERVAFALDQLRMNGALVAVDDAGAGYSGLQQILTTRPDILKIDRALVERIDTDEAKAALVEMLGVFANRVDAWILAEGIETLAEARRCAGMGLPLAQGYFFGRPAPPWSDVDGDAIIGLADLVRRDRDTGLRALLAATPSTTAGAVESERYAFADANVEHVVVLGADERPTGVLTPGAALSGRLLRTLIANVNTTPAELAHRVATGGHDLTLPVIVTDNAGRYLGTVSTRRLVAHLAGGDSTVATAPPT